MRTLKNLDSDLLDDTLSYLIDKYPEDEREILFLLEEKQYRMENEIYVHEKDTTKKKISKKERERIHKSQRRYFDSIFE